LGGEQTETRFFLAAHWEKRERPVASSKKKKKKRGIKKTDEAGDRALGTGCFGVETEKGGRGDHWPLDDLEGKPANHLSRKNCAHIATEGRCRVPEENRGAGTTLIVKEKNRR